MSNEELVQSIKQGTDPAGNMAALHKEPRDYLFRC